MNLFSIILTIIIAIFVYLLILSRSRKDLSKVFLGEEKRHTKVRNLAEPKSLCPFMVFNMLSTQRQFIIFAGSIISENLYIVDGEVEIIFENQTIGTIKKGEITHNCFDLLGIPIEITKKALSDLLVVKLPFSSNSYVNTKYFEKICFDPLLRFCKAHSQIAELETWKTENFEDFIKDELELTDYEPEILNTRYDINIEDKVIYIVSGKLNINGKIFQKNSIFGYFGVFFNYYKGFQVTNVSDNNELIIKYVPYEKIKKAKLNIEVLKNLKKEFIYLGSTLKWNIVEPGYQLIKKKQKYDEFYLIGGSVIGAKECILEQPCTSDYSVDRLSYVITIPKTTIQCLLSCFPSFYSIFIQKLFENNNEPSKVVLITPATEICDAFILRLHRALFTKSIIIKNSNISEIMGKHAFRAVGELILYENILKLQEKYKVIIIYLENEYARLLNLIIPICDTIFLVGQDVIRNRYYKNNVEFIKLYESRPIPQKQQIKIKKMLFSNFFYGSKADDKESVNKVEISPLDKGKTEKDLENQVSKKYIKSSKFRPVHIDNLDTPNYRRIHHVLCPKKDNFCNKDFERFARYLLNESFGLVLGGGGARGLAHIGVIQALEEENIPIDIVGGTSMGAFVGALYARQLDYITLYSEAKKLSKKAASKWKVLSDFTYPYASLFSGRIFRSVLRSIFKQEQIQNFWLEYYCVTTSLKTLEECIHFNGPAYQYIMASMSISGVTPPIFFNDDILCDGSYVNNVPTDVMLSLGVKNVFSVDVGTSFLEKYDAYDSKSGLILFFRSLFESKKYLSLIDMQYRLTFISTSRKEELIKDNSLLIKPNLTGYTTSDFHKFDEIVACGYESAKKKIRECKINNKLPEFRKRLARFSI